jgi:hypothetical protein
LLDLKAVEALDFNVVVVAVDVLELLVLPPDPQPVNRNIKTASAPIGTKPNSGDRIISKYLTI